MEENVTMGKAVYDQPELNPWDPKVQRESQLP